MKLQGYYMCWFFSINFKAYIFQNAFQSSASAHTSVLPQRTIAATRKSQTLLESFSPSTFPIPWSRRESSSSFAPTSRACSQICRVIHIVIRLVVDVATFALTNSLLYLTCMPKQFYINYPTLLFRLKIHCTLFLGDNKPVYKNLGLWPL